MQEFEIEFEPTAKEFEIDISNKVREVTPSLIDLEVTPSKEEQIFTHEGEFGYDKVKVNSTPLQEKEIVPSKEVIEVVPDEDYLALEKVTVNSIPEEYTIPKGTIEIIRNGVYDVKDYVNADVKTNGVDINDYFQSVYDGTEQSKYYFSKNLFKKIPTLTVTKGVTTLESLLSDLAVKNVPLKVICTDSVNNMNRFAASSTITDLDLTGMDVSNVTTLNYAFSSCYYLVNLDITGWNTSKVTNMDSMFYYCNRLENIKLSSFDTQNVTNMSNMFNNCSQLKELDLSNSNTSNVTNMNNMFGNCFRLMKLDIRKFSFAKVTLNSKMFSGVPANCEIIVADDEARNWILGVRSDLSNIKTVAEL